MLHIKYFYFHTSQSEIDRLLNKCFEIMQLLWELSKLMNFRGECCVPRFVPDFPPPNRHPVTPSLDSPPPKSTCQIAISSTPLGPSNRGRGDLLINIFYDIYLNWNCINACIGVSPRRVQRNGVLLGELVIPGVPNVQLAETKNDINSLVLGGVSLKKRYLPTYRSLERKKLRGL